MRGLNRVVGVALAMAVASMVAACGDDDESACRSAGAAICERACECREGAECAVTDSMGGLTLSFDSEADCNALYQDLGCSGGGDGSIDFDKCEADISGGMCIESGTDEMGNPAQAFAAPDSCSSMM